MSEVEKYSYGLLRSNSPLSFKGKENKTVNLAVKTATLVKALEQGKITLVELVTEELNLSRRKIEISTKNKKAVILSQLMILKKEVDVFSNRKNYADMITKQLKKPGMTREQAMKNITVVIRLLENYKKELLEIE